MHGAQARSQANLKQARREAKKEKNNKQTNRLSQKTGRTQVGTFPSPFGERVLGLVGKGLGGVSSPSGLTDKS